MDKGKMSQYGTEKQEKKGLVDFKSHYGEKCLFLLKDEWRYITVSQKKSLVGVCQRHCSTKKKAALFREAAQDTVLHFVKLCFLL